MEGTSLFLWSSSQNLQALPFGRAAVRLANSHPGSAKTSVPDLCTGFMGAGLPEDSSCTQRCIHGSLLVPEERRPGLKAKMRRGEAALPRSVPIDLLVSPSLLDAHCLHHLLFQCL